MGVRPEPCQRPSSLKSASPRPNHSTEPLPPRSDSQPERKTVAFEERNSAKDDAGSEDESVFDEEALEAKRASIQEVLQRIHRSQIEMDTIDEKAAAQRDAQGQDVTSPTPEVFVDAPQQSDQETVTGYATTEDPEKEAMRKEIQNKHLSLASSADVYKRESIETPPRASTLLSDSASERTIEASMASPVPQQEEPRPPASRSRVTLQVPDEDQSTHRPARPIHSRGATVASGITVASSRRSMPSLRRRETKLAQKKAHPWQHLGITLGLPMVITFDLVVPCIIYYVWYDHRRDDHRNRCNREFPGVLPCPIQQELYNRHILGWSIASFGLGEVWILAARVWRLYFRREECAPLLSRSKWELDATAWVYGVAVLCALIPFIIGSELEIPELYLYSPCFIFAFLGILMFITTLIPIKLPIGINSHPRGTRIRPFIYYAAEDFIAVDGLQDREFRVRYNERYEHNKMFRQFFFNLTLFWIFGVMVYIGCASAIIWNLKFNYAYGLIFGILFSWIAVWAGITYLWVHYEMRREARAYEDGEVDA